MCVQESAASLVKVLCELLPVASLARQSGKWNVEEASEFILEAGGFPRRE